jgi:EmrB/QacA subfamily drug resistance transporter
MRSAQLQWVVTGYALTFGSLLLVGGRGADLLGRRRLLVMGLALFAIASLGCGLAQSPLMLIVARLVQGAAGAAVSPAALSLLTSINPEGPQRNRALSIWQAAMAAGATTGVIAGGLLTQYFGWRAIFLVNPPLIAILLVFVPRLLPAGGSVKGQRVDIRGALLVTTALALFIFGLNEGEQRGFGHVATIGALVGAVLLGAGFVINERTVAAPMLPFSLFRSATHRAAMIAMLVMGGILAAYVYFLSLFLQGIEGFSPVGAGLALVPATVMAVLTSTFLTRRLLSRFGVKQILIIGLASISAGQFWLSFISTGTGYAAVVLPGVLLTAFGIGLAFPTASVAMTSGVDRRDQGLAGALFVTGQQIGAAVGLALLATVAATRAARMHNSLVAGYQLSFVVAAALAAAAIVIVAIQLNAHSCQKEFDRQRADGSTHIAQRRGRNGGLQGAHTT